MTAFIVFGHGSRIESANQAVRDAAREMALAGSHTVEAAFLELGQPDLAGAAEVLIARGATRIIVIPYFLTLGLHLHRDLPRLVQDVSARHQHVEMHVTAPLDGHPALVEALLDRASQAQASREAQS